MIKDLTRDDVKTIVELSKDFPDGWKEEMYLRQNGLNLKGYFLDGKLVGFICYCNGEDFTDLEIIFVSKEYRKKGIGSRLIDEMIKGAKPTVFLEVRKSNSPAISLYESKGFTFLNDRKKYYYDGEDCAVYIKKQ